MALCYNLSDIPPTHVQPLGQPEKSERGLSLFYQGETFKSDGSGGWI